MPKGERPPPFFPPPTSVGCGGESWGDHSHVQRVLNRYTEMAKKVGERKVWSIECLGLEQELVVRYKIAMDVLLPSGRVDISVVRAAQESALRHLQTIETQFFESGNDPELLWLRSAGGWIGATNRRTVKKLENVRTELLRLYADLRKRLDNPPSDWSVYIKSVHSHVETQLDRLFSITGPDEQTWSDWIRDLADGARIIKVKASEMSKAMPLS